MNYSYLIEPDIINNEPYIFVSYSRKDTEPVQKVLKILRDNCFRFWYDRGLKSGTEWAEELGEKIDQCDQFLALLSPNSVQSKYVRKEISMAIDKGKNILVLYLEDTTLTSGLQLLLGDIQAIRKGDFGNETDFEFAICEAVSNNTLYQKRNVFDTSDETPNGDAKAELLRNYELMSQIGSGGISQVYLAKQKRTGAIVAVKCGSLDNSYRGTVTKHCFETEKFILMELMRNMCPFTPTILDWFEDDAQIFLVESWIGGSSLKTQTLSSEEDVVAIARKVLNILRYLHGNNIVYGDMKPANLILDSYGEVHLIDFNTSISLQKGNVEKKMLMGTAGFAPPEQFRVDGSVSFASDVYALGRTMEYLLCPERFDRNARIPIRYYRQDVSVELEAILEKMTAVSQKDRYQSVEELLHELETYKTTGFLNKIILRRKSERNIKAFECRDRESREVRKNTIHELATELQSGGYETVILSNPDVSDSDETVVLMDGDPE